MSAPRPRVVRGLAASAVAATLMVATLAASAQAAGSSTVTIAQAKKSVPSAKLIPGSVTLTGPVGMSKKAVAIPCLTAPKQVTLKGDAAEGDYLGKATSPLSPKYLSWTVTVIAFPSAAKAAAGAATLMATEKTCPKTRTTTAKGVTEMWTRSLGLRYTVGAFKGYRSVEHLTISDGTNTVTLRAFETFLVHGNVLLSLEEVAGATPANGKEQDTWRKAVTTLMTQRIAAVK